MPEGNPTLFQQEERQSILQIDSFRRLRSCNILTSPMCSSVGRETQGRKLIQQRRPWIYDMEASATEWGLFPSGLEVAATLGDLWWGWHSRLLSVTEKNWTWSGFGFFYCVCLCSWRDKWNLSTPDMFVVVIRLDRYQTSMTSFVQVSHAR